MSKPNRTSRPAAIKPLPDFAHPGHIAPSRALAVRAITCNEAVPSDWATLDFWVSRRGIDAVLADFLEIVAMNGGGRGSTPEKERAWWSEQLAGDARENAPGGAA